MSSSSFLPASITFLRDRLYLMAYPFVRPCLGKNKRYSRTRYEALRPNVFKAIDGTAREIYFYSTQRARLYFTPKGIEGRVQVVGDKYQTDGCRVEPGDVVFDIGANIGEFSISVRDTAARTFSFEPDPVARGALEENARYYATFQVMPLAMGETPGELTFYISSDGADSSIIEPETYTRVMTVQVTTISTIITELGLDQVDFIKLEAEGFEPEILKGAGKNLRKVRKIAVDVSPERYGESPAADVVALLRSAGFNTWQRDSIIFGNRTE